jgi:hypothetical protein
MMLVDGRKIARGGEAKRDSHCADSVRNDVSVMECWLLYRQDASVTRELQGRGGRRGTGDGLVGAAGYYEVAALKFVAQG